MTRLRNMHKQTQAAVEDSTVALFYTPHDRSYGILCAEPGLSPEEKGLTPHWNRSYYYISFCPWSGRYLPYELEDQWHKMMFEKFDNDYDFDYTGDDYKCPPFVEIPQKYRTEEWWSENTPPQLNSYTEDNRPDNEQEVPLSEPYEYLMDKNRPGSSSWPDRPPHLCWASEKWYWGPRCMYAYLPHTREYGIRVLDMSKPVDHQPIVIRPVPYCPFCGKEHPPSLRTEWEKRMHDRGLDPTIPRNPFSEPLPDGLDGEHWWRQEQQKSPNAVFGYPPLHTV